MQKYNIATPYRFAIRRLAFIRIISIIPMQLKYHKSIYKKTAIVEAAAEFKHLAEFKISNNKNYYIVDAGNIVQDVAGQLADEFSNYVIYLMNT